MNDLDVDSIYLVAPISFELEKENLEKFLDFCQLNQNFDLVGVKQATTYDKSSFSDSVFMEFDLSLEELNKKWSDYKHRNITLYNWEEESAFKEVVDTIQSVVQEKMNKENEVKQLSLLLGEHILTDGKEKMTSFFSLAFLMDNPIPLDISVTLQRDSHFCSQLEILNEYFGTQFAIIGAFS